ncbi:MAG: hypothetical protein RDU20_18825 [Desulfomonilaceae bacterium]|nr:hypothetical protein [Desulfomonilaceae bacterium]
MTSSSDGDGRSPATENPVLARIEAQLRKGNYLRGDDRPLPRILEEDAAEVSRLQMDLEEITSLMKRFYDEGRKALGDPVKIDDTFEVTVREDRGILACPFRDHFPAPKAIITAVNLKTGKILRFTVLGWHLIHAHGFFQGKESPFRIEPSDLKDFFE